ncbi:MAG: hypothetical protein AAFV43_16765 [Planctomycetota bacterium]
MMTLAVATLAVAAWADADPGRDGPRGGGPPGSGERGFGPPPPPPQSGGIRMGMLLRLEEVREELALTDDQVQQLREAGREMRSRRGDRQGPPRPPRGEGRRGEGARRGGPPGEGPPREGRRGEDSLSGEERGARPPRGPRGEGRGDRRGRMRERLTDRGAEAEERLSGILTDDQLTRLKQIALQQRVRRQGPRALTNGPLADELGVSEEQGDQLREKADELRGALAQQIRAVTDASRQELFNELTTEQQAKLEEMLGEPFEMPPPPKRMSRRQGPPSQGGPPRGGPPRGGRREGPPPREF